MFESTNVERVDFDETFSPFSIVESIRLLLRIPCTMKWGYPSIMQTKLSIIFKVLFRSLERVGERELSRREWRLKLLLTIDCDIFREGGGGRENFRRESDD